MGTYHQLTEHQRYQMYALKKAGHDQQSITATVGVSPSTIGRELRRNRGQRGYRPGQAHHKALARRRHKAKATKMTAAAIERIEAGLGQEWSPEQIAGRLAATDGLRLSPQRIYQHIQADRQAGVRCIATCVTVRRNARNAMGKPMPEGRLKTASALTSARPSSRRKGLLQLQSKILTHASTSPSCQSALSQSQPLRHHPHRRRSRNRLREHDAIAVLGTGCQDFVVAWSSSQA